MKIWLCWFQGEQDSSLSSRDKTCIERWRKVAGSHEVIVLDKNKIDQILPEYQDIINACTYERSLQHKADLLRLLLLEKYGGIWSDTSVYPLEDADEIIKQTTSNADVFFYSFSKKRISETKGDRLIANWFIIAKEPNNYAIQALTSEYKKRFTTAEQWRYFEMHQAYCDLIEYDSKFCDSISNMQQLSAESALVLGRKKMGLLKDGQINSYNKSTLMVKRPAPISLALLPCIDIKSPVKTIIQAIIQIEKLQSTPDDPIIPRSIADEILRNYKRINQSEGVLTPALRGKTRALHQKLLSIDSSQNTRLQKIAYLHIGKCAGTTLYDYFKSNSEIDITYLHMKRIELTDCINYSFAFFIRHPISRFISAFNHTKRIVELDTSGLNINQLNHSNSYSPKRIRRKMMHGGIAFSEQYDQLVRHFSSANGLAESLYSEDKKQRQKAQNLMSLPNEHLYKGIGWYLHNGELIKRFSENIKFVGCVETIEKDIQIAKSLFGLNITSDQTKRKRLGLSSSMDSLTALAIRNLQQWYQNTDYQAIQSLYNHGLISEDIYSYYQLPPTISN